MAKVCDIEQLLKTHLVSIGGVFQSSKIFLQEFPINATGDDLFLIKRVGTGSSPLNIDVDTPIVRVWARDSDPHEAYLNQKAVGDILHGLNPVNVASSRFLFGQLIAGPERDDDLEVDLPQWAASYQIRVAV